MKSLFIDLLFIKFNKIKSDLTLERRWILSEISWMVFNFVILWFVKYNFVRFMSCDLWFMIFKWYRKGIFTSGWVWLQIVISGKRGSGCLCTCHQNQSEWEYEKESFCFSILFLSHYVLQSINKKIYHSLDSRRRKIWSSPTNHLFFPFLLL